MMKISRTHLSRTDFPVAFFLWLYSAKFYEANPQAIAEGMQGNATDPAPMPQPAFDSQAAACMNHDTRGKLGGIAAPALITAGSRDIFVPLECSQYLHEHIKNSTLEVFEGYAHTHHWEDLARYNKITSEFINKHK
jgi:pimeloyl-ACP methyl ester carboxylesterase